MPPPQTAPVHRVGVGVVVVVVVSLQTQTSHDALEFE